MSSSGGSSGVRTLEQLGLGGAPSAEAAHAALAVTAAIAARHAGAGAHGGIRPAEIELVGDSARVREPHGPCPQGDPGLAYRPPEWFVDRAAPADVRGDLYSLGMILYELFAGRLPFTAEDALGWQHAHLAMTVPPLQSVRPDVPAGVASVVERLLAKRPTGRYPTALEVLEDLRVSLAGTGAETAVPRPVGHVVPSTAVHGRAAERAEVRSALARARASGVPLLVTVAGAAGIGKSALCTELLDEVRSGGGLAGAAKFHERFTDVPFATLPAMFGRLVDDLLVGEVPATREADVERLRRRVLKELGPSAGLATRAVPALERLIGPQPLAPATGGQEATARFLETMRRLVAALAAGVPALALCFDDLQWADSSSVSLIQQLAAGPGIPGLVLVLAYRPEAVAEAVAEAITHLALENGKVLGLRLGPLDVEGIGALVADALGEPVERVETLGRVVHNLSGGNPFVAVRVLWELQADGTIRYDLHRRTWVFDLHRYEGHPVPGGGDGLTLTQLARLPRAGRLLLGVASCVRGDTDLEVLSTVTGLPADAVHAALAPAVEAGLVAGDGHQVRFTHDRVRHAASRLLSDRRRPQVQRDLARALRGQAGSVEDLGERVFDVVEQYGATGRVPAAAAERRDVVRLYREAARQAQVSGAFAAAQRYLDQALHRLRAVDWRSARELAVAVHQARAEVAFAQRDLPLARQLAERAFAQARTWEEDAAARTLLIELLFMQGKVAELVELGVAAAARQGFVIPLHPGPEVAATAYWPVHHRLTEMTCEQVTALPECRDAQVRATVRALGAFAARAILFDPDLAVVATARVLDLTLRCGLMPESPNALSLFAVITCGRYQRYADALRFAGAAFELTGDPRLAADRSAVHVQRALVMRWSELPRAVLPHLAGALDTARAAGRTDDVCHILCWQIVELLWTDRPLGEMTGMVEDALRYVDGVGYPPMSEFLRSLRWFVRRLRGQHRPGPDGTDEEADGIAQRLQQLPFVALRHEANRMCLLTLEGDAEQVLLSTGLAAGLGLETTGLVEIADISFYRGLAAASLADSVPSTRRRELLAQVEADLSRVRGWAVSGPERFGCRAALLGAEYARVIGDDGAAGRGYEDAVQLAADTDQLGMQALAAQTAARFYSTGGRPRVGAMFRALARGAYVRWGASARVAALDAESAAAPGPVGAGGSGDVGDAVAVTRASQAISGIVDLGELVHRLMQIMLQESGGDYAALLLVGTGGRLELAADAWVPRHGAVIEVRTYPPGTAADAASLPAAVVAEASASQTPVQLDDAAAEAVGNDPRLIRPAPKALLCLPMLHRGTLRGLMYLENSLLPHAFPVHRRRTLELLATQAAISLEIAASHREQRLLNEQLEERVAERTQQLQATIQQLEAFSYSVSHDLRAPLRAVHGFATALAEDYAERLDPEGLDLLEKVIGSAERMSRLIGDLLTFSRIGRQQLVHGPVDMNDLVAAAVEEVLVAGPSQRPQVIVGDLPPATGDTSMLTQVWINLLSNAVKFTSGSRDPRIEVYADTDDDRVVYHVRDNGVGFDPAQALELFGAFRRLHGGAYPGTGIGLAIVHDVIARHGGRVWADADDGKGATFSFTLPGPAGRTTERIVPDHDAAPAARRGGIE